MLKFKLSNQTYSVPVSWSEVKYIDFAKSREKPLTERLSIYTGIPLEIVNNIPLSEIKKIIDIVSFMDEMPDAFVPVDLDINVGDEHYIKMEQSRKVLETAENQWIAAIEIVKTYTEQKDEKGEVIKKGLDISEIPVPESLGYAVFFLNKLTPSLKSINA